MPEGYAGEEAKKRGVSFSNDVAKAPPVLPKVNQDWKIPDKYQVKKLIGTGSYGSVCEAYDAEAQKNVAVKRCREIFEDLVDCKRILREIAILSALDHPNCVHIASCIVPEAYSKFNEIYIIMDICDSDMKKLCRTNVSLEVAHIKVLLYNLLVGLKYIHSAGVYHRDLKPANCLVNQDCSVKICDFGLARAVDVASDPTELPDSPREAEDEQGSAQAPRVPHTLRLKRNLTTHVVTRWYRAPELILLQEDYTESIDVWSVGCIFAELIGMLPGTKVVDRGPLFPGQSCFPLSPDHRHMKDYKFHTKAKSEQLNVIFSYIGTPSAEDIAHLSPEAQAYIKKFAEVIAKPQPFKEHLPQATDEVLDILEKTLKFSPKKRVTVAEALDNPLFSDIRQKARETTFAKGPLVLSFENDAVTEDNLRSAYEETVLRMTQQIK